MTAEGALVGHLERTAQRAGAERLLALDGLGHTRARRVAPQLAEAPDNDRRIEGDDEQPHHERRRARKGNPPRIAQHEHA